MLSVRKKTGLSIFRPGLYFVLASSAHAYYFKLKLSSCLAFLKAHAQLGLTFPQRMLVAQNKPKNPLQRRLSKMSIPNNQYCGSGALFYPCTRDPGWKKTGSGSGMNISNYFSDSLETGFWVKNTYILLCGSGSGIRDVFYPGSGIWDLLDPGSGIWYKHPGSATLLTRISADEDDKAKPYKNSKPEIITPIYGRLRKFNAGTPLRKQYSEILRCIRIITRIMQIRAEKH